MLFFSGFSLKNEEYLFREYIQSSEYSVAGFSYGCIYALNSVLEKIAAGSRVDRLQLFSPAFFQTKDIKFKRLQLMSYKKNRDIYMHQFIESCFSPYEKKIVEHKDTKLEELQELLEYEWSLETLKVVQESGVKIEVYLGGKDIIIDVEAARELFLQVSTVTYIKDANHFLQIQ